MYVHELNFVSAIYFKNAKKIIQIILQISTKSKSPCYWDAINLFYKSKQYYSTIQMINMMVKNWPSDQNLTALKCQGNDGFEENRHKWWINQALLI